LKTKKGSTPVAVRFDHAIIGVHNLNAACDTFTRLGFTVTLGGAHAAGTTHNALICFRDGSYIELMAPTGKDPEPENTTADYRSVLHESEGPVGMALQTDDLTAGVTGIRSRGIEIGDALTGGRLRRDGVSLRWHTAMLPDAVTPFFIEDLTDRKLRVPDSDEATDHSNGVEGVAAVNIVAADAQAEAKRYATLLGFEPEADGDYLCFKLGNCQLNVHTGALDRDMQAHLERHGVAPYQIELSTPQAPALYIVHGARLNLRPA
jgi:catechol 2,3-dioxygenase-like lactoylglutathione lyase family enzyme